MRVRIPYSPVLILVLLMPGAGALSGQQSGWVPPEYADTTSFREIELRVGADTILPAILTLPRGNGPFAAVVLVHGSGPADRNEAVGPNRPFQDLAWGLATRGITVLRYDKRTKVRPSSFLGRPYTVADETLRDALDAVTRLRARAEVDPARVVILGHSLGGILAPRLAQADGQLAGIVIAEGATRNGFLSMIDTQVTYLRALPGADTSALDRLLTNVRSAQLAAADLTAADSANSRLILGIPASYYVDLASYDPAAVARTLNLPILVIQGGRDYQVTPEAMAAWRREVGERPNMVIVEFPTINHLMIPGTGMPRPSEYGIPGHVAGEVVDTVASWIRRLTPPRALPPSDTPSPGS